MTITAAARAAGAVVGPDARYAVGARAESGAGAEAHGVERQPTIVDPLLELVRAERGPATGETPLVPYSCAACPHRTPS